MNMLIFLVSAFATTLKGQTFELMPISVEIGSSFTMNCITTIDGAIDFRLEGNLMGSCPVPFGVPLPCNPVEISQDVPSTNTSWTITSATSNHNGTWNCRKGSVDSNELQLYIFQCANSATGTGITSDLVLNGSSTVNVNVDIDCLFSSNTPTIQMIFQRASGANISVVLTCSTASTTCSTGLSAYQCTLEISKSLPLTINIEYSLNVEIIPTGALCESFALFSPYTVKISSEGESGTDGKSCDEPLIYMLFFILALVCVTTSFFLVIWFNLRCVNIGKAVLIIIGVVVDLVFEIILLWGIEYGSDFKLFNSDIKCPVVIIGVVCHVVAVVVEIVKVIVQYLYIEELGARIFVCCRPDGEIKKVRKSAEEEHPSHTLLPAYGDGRKGSSDDNQSKTVAKPEDIMLFMHFNVPFGYTVNKWVTEENASIENNPKYVSNDKGTLLIKSATEKDNGIYQGILTSDGNEQRLNAVLHVTGQKSANLIINPLIWRQVKTKKLKKISDLKEIRHKVSRNDIGSIPTKNEDESNVSIKSIRWMLNGNTAHTLSNYKEGDDNIPPHTVTKNRPIDEYHCTVEFSNKKSHVYIFIVKFTGVSYANTPQSTAMHNNKVDMVDDVVGVPTILSTRREENTSSLPPLRHTATTSQDRQTSDSLPVD